MPPLTHTLTETETLKTPLIPVGSFATQPLVAEVATKMHGLLSDEKQREVKDRIYERAQKKAHLTSLLEELKASQKGYDFSDYEERLLFLDEEIENILETEIFRNSGELTEFGKSFYEYLEIVTVGNSEEMKGRMKKKLVREFGLVDRVYEGNSKIGGVNGWYKRISFEDREQFFREVQDLYNSWIKSLDLWHNDLGDTLDVSDLIILLQQVGRLGIKSLEIRTNRLYEITAPNFIKLVQQAGHSGIKSLDLWDNCLGEKLDTPDFITLAQQAGHSGIKSLNLSSTYFFEPDVHEFIRFVQQSWHSGIKILSLRHNRLGEILDASDFITLVQQAGHSGIRKLDLWYNLLGEKLETPDFITLIQQAGHSGIKNLDLWENDFDNILTAPDFITLVQQAAHSGIKRIEITSNGFTGKLGASQKQELDSIIKQFDMKLN